MTANVTKKSDYAVAVRRDSCRDRRERRGLARGLFDFRNPVGTLQYFAWLGTIGGADDAVLLHQIDEVRGAAVADAQAALQQRSGSFAELDDQLHGIAIHGIV